MSRNEVETAPMTDTMISRRNLLSLMAVGTASTLAGCASSGPVTRGYTITYRDNATQVVDPSMGGGNSELDVMYGQIADGGFVIPAVPYQKIPSRFYRQRVFYPNDGYYAYRYNDYRRCWVERRYDPYYDQSVRVRVCN